MNPFISINSVIDWQKGLYENVLVTPFGIKLDHEVSKQGLYFGDIIDSMETGNQWSRMTLNLESRGETKLILRTLALDELTFMRNGIRYDLEQIFREGKMDVKELSMVLESLKPSRFEDHDQVLLHREEGRYLIYWLEWIAEGPSTIVRSIKIYYKKSSFISYLPQIYTESSEFLEPYLSVFQTIHEDLEEVVGKMAEIYMPEKTDVTFLEVLEQWLPLDGKNSWTEAQKRYLLSHYQTFNDHRGTRASVLQYASLFIGSEPLVVEHWEYKYLKDSEYHQDLYKKLYNDNPYGFTLILQSDVPLDKKQYLLLTEMMRQVVPAQTTFTVAQLKPYMVLDDYVYLGFNSLLFNQTDMKLDEQSILSMGLISGDNEKG